MGFILEEKEGESFTGLDLAESQNLAEAYTDCDFHQCHFQGADLERIRFVDCRFEACNLSLSQLRGAVFHDCRFKDCKLVALDWTQTSSLRSLHFENCVMDGSNFSGLQLAHTHFGGSRLADARFQNAKLRNANFADCDLEGAEFLNADLRSADLRGARQYRISPIDTQVSKAQFSMPEAMGLLLGFGIVID